MAPVRWVKPPPSASLHTAIKFLMEDHEYDFIESGSLLGINYKGGDDEDDDIVAVSP